MNSITYREVRHLFQYINEIHGCACFADMLVYKLFPNVKEITESCGAYEVVFHKTTKYALNDPAVTVVVVGDGNTPRTAAMFAMRTAYTCLSIDPRLKKDKIKYWENNIQRLKCYPCRVEDMTTMTFDKLLIIAVHSHANLQTTVDKFIAKERMVIAIPCCVAQELNYKPDMEYVDESIWSPCNTVKVWEGK